MGSSFQNLVAPTQNLGASGDRAPVRQQPCPFIQAAQFLKFSLLLFVQISSNLGDWQFLYIDLFIITSLALVSKFNCVSSIIIVCNIQLFNDITQLLKV